MNNLLKIYSNSKVITRVCCNMCQKIGMIDTSKIVDNKIFSIKCSCGNIIKAVVDHRKNYRKEVNLYGSCEVKNYTIDILVLDVSITGLKFELLGKSSIDAGDYINISFNLDNKHRSRIHRRLHVLRRNGVIVAGEFCDSKIDKELGFYMYP